MSVVSTGAHYDYPRTSASGFRCATGLTQADLPNNSAAQAWQYLQNVQVGQEINFGIYRVDGCRGSEDIWDKIQGFTKLVGEKISGLTFQVEI